MICGMRQALGVVAIVAIGPSLRSGCRRARATQTTSAIATKADIDADTGQSSPASEQPAEPSTGQGLLPALPSPAGSPLAAGGASSLGDEAPASSADPGVATVNSGAGLPVAGTNPGLPASGAPTAVAAASPAPASPRVSSPTIGGKSQPVPSIQPPKEPIRTIDGLTARVRSTGLTRVDEALAVLSADIRGQLTLMSGSQSRHQASPDYPCLILYGDTGRFIVAASSHPDDPLRETIEMAELLPEGW